MHYYFKKNLIFILTLLLNSTCFAAELIDLKHQTILPALSHDAYQMKIKTETTDFNQTKHVRYQEFFNGYPVWGADFVAHTPKNNTPFMNGIIYQSLEKDLKNPPSYLFDNKQKEKIIQHIVFTHQKQSGLSAAISRKEAKPFIFVDKNNIAHWVYLVSFEINSTEKLPQQPKYLVDALTMKIYQQWDDIQTLNDNFGGGFGGNERVGKFVYDGLKNHYPKLNIQRDAEKNICYLQNADVTVKHAAQLEIIQFNCKKTDNKHNNVYWNANHDAVNGAYSPSNDALHIGKIVKQMYQDWYGVPVLTEDGKPMMLNMQVHLKIDNAYWDGHQMFFGDGVRLFYPLVTLGVGAHEISHGFTEQHANLAYYGQSGGLNESFSDMAAQAATYYATEKNNWLIGDDIFKQKNKALRYMDEPTKDCDGKKPGEYCSISHVKDFYDGLDVHYSSGIFNKIFYLIATAKNWNTKKAFDVMVKANQDYWTSMSDFSAAACGVLHAARDYKYSLTAITAAFEKVGIKIDSCE